MNQSWTLVHLTVVTVVAERERREYFSGSASDVSRLRGAGEPVQALHDHRRVRTSRDVLISSERRDEANSKDLEGVEESRRIALIHGEVQLTQKQCLMGKLKVVAESADPQLTLSINFERPDATFAAGEVLSGSIAFNAVHPFDCEGITLTMTAKEQVDGNDGRPFRWEHVLLERKINLDRGQCESVSAGPHSIAFTIDLDTTLAPSYTFESVSIGSRTQIKLARFYALSATFALRNSTKVETAAEIVLKRNTDVVWPGSLPSVSLEDMIAHPVGSTLSNCLCWRRGDTTVSATIHNRTVDIASGVVHVRVFVVNRSSLSVTAARLCLLVDTALHPERADTEEKEEDEENAPVHMIELLSATDYHKTQIAHGSSAHLNLELDVKRVALSLLFDQETVLEPSIRTRYLEIGYIIRVEVCHAKGGSTVSLDLPLVLVPLESDILPPLETQPLNPIRGRDSQASTEHEDEESDTKSHQPVSSRVSSMELRAPETAITSVIPTNTPVDEDVRQPRDLPPAPPMTKVYERDIMRGGM